ncbi:carboxylesterase family protein [Pseudonocardia sp. KRD291]|uniref:carboxylesterase family protein n=1 Tax=Pseudonocardia sp. KRD291 TaxID=2792007 RepID=UPI001C4A5610|nr:carboxylesterase family protein [Pseudonocardia sp. KRD291]MBW0106167.1 carboxylesterase/lipase family protein [Pseudonocardia sp. KRD291]
MSSPALSVDTPVVWTSEGRLRGRREGGVTVFRGVDYARAPSGAQRFAAPQPPLPWSGVRDAFTPGPACPQLPSPFAALFGDPTEPQSEDCLHLTVWTPATDDAARPVLVWLHGGSYLTGSGNLPRYDGAELAAEHDAVVVLVTYRIGVLGFPPFADAVPMSPDGDGFGTGSEPVRNVGAWDLLAALQWVHRNAAAFGGNPSAVCALGQSAGAQILAALLRLPATTSLLDRAVLHSGPLGLDPIDGEDAAAEFSRVTGVGTARAARGTGLDVILEGQGAVVSAPAARGDVRPGVRLVSDGVLAGGPTSVPDPPATALPLLVTTARDECRLWFSDGAAPDDAGLRQAVAAQFGEQRTDEVIERYRAAVGGAPASILSAIYTDAIFTAPNQQYAEAAARAGNPVQLARFDVAARGRHRSYGAAHCIDIPFVLGSEQGRRMPLLEGWSAAELTALRDEVRGRWARFARGEFDSAGDAVSLIGGTDRTSDALLAPEVRPLWR